MQKYRNRVLISQVRKTSLQWRSRRSNHRPHIQEITMLAVMISTQLLQFQQLFIISATDTSIPGSGASVFWCDRGQSGPWRWGQRIRWPWGKRTRYRPSGSPWTARPAQTWPSCQCCGQQHPGKSPTGNPIPLGGANGSSHKTVVFVTVHGICQVWTI